MRRDRTQRDERNVGNAEIGARVERAGLDLADVRPLHHGHARVLAQGPRDLGAPDVDRVYVLGAALQQTVGEPTGRRAHIDRATALHVDRERVEPARQLVTAARHICRTDRCEHRDRLSPVDLAGRGRGRRTTDEHPARVDGLDRAGPAGEEAAPHELDIEPPPHAAVSLPWPLWTRPSWRTASSTSGRVFWGIRRKVGVQALACSPAG